MSAEDFAGVKALKAARKELRQTHGVGCPKCAIRLPKAPPKKLLPQEYCPHDGYQDQRPWIADEIWSGILKKHGLTEVKREKDSRRS